MSSPDSYVPERVPKESTLDRKGGRELGEKGEGIEKNKWLATKQSQEK